MKIDSYMNDTTTEERIKNILSTHYRKTSEWHTVYGLKQMITRTAGYCLEHELAEWLKDIGFSVRVTIVGRKNQQKFKYFVKAQIRKTSMFYRDNNKFIEEYQKFYPEWDKWRILPKEPQPPRHHRFPISKK